MMRENEKKIVVNFVENICDTDNLHQEKCTTVQLITR